MDNIKVSVIVPVYNCKKYIARCVRSILTQSHTNLELICVDDGSDDGTKDVLARLERMYPERMRVLENAENMGPGISRDIGVRCATGEYLCFVDADDYLLPDYLERYVGAVCGGVAQSALEADSSAHGASAAKGVAQGGLYPDVIIGGYRSEKADGKLAIHARQDNVWSAVTYVVCWSKLYRREFVVGKGLEFGNFKCLEDMHFNLLGYMNRMKYVVIDYAGYVHCDNALSVTKSMVTAGGGVGAAGRDGATGNARKYSAKTGYAIDDGRDGVVYGTTETVSNVGATDGNEVAKCVKAVFDSLERHKSFKHLSQTTQWTLQYAYAANMANSLVVYAKKLKTCGAFGGDVGKPELRRLRNEGKLINDSYRSILKDMKSRFPGIGRNPFFKGAGPAGETARIRLGVMAFMSGRRTC